MNLNSKLVFRRLLKNKFIWINILGLSLGIAVFMTLFLFIQHENLYEKSHANHERIYRIEQNKKEGEVFRKTAGIPTATALVIDQDVSGIECATRFNSQSSAPVKLQTGTHIMVDDIVFADREFLAVFSYPVVHGAPFGKLDQPNMAVISQDLSKKLFGTDNSVGQKLRLNETDIEIQSVVETISDKSHLNFSLLISFETIQTSDPSVGWFDNWSHGYVLLEDARLAEDIDDLLVDYLKKYQGPESENELYLKPLTDIHLRSEVTDEFALVGSYQNNWIYSVIAALIIVIACINYINLTIAYASNRFREIGIKKLVGADRLTLIRQLMGESSITLLIAMVLVLMLIELMLPTFNELVNRELDINYLDNWEFYLVFVSISLFIGFVTGFIPAKAISGLGVLSLATKVPVKRKQGNLFRHGLVLFQFFVSITLISCTLLIFKQYHFLKNTDLGYDKDHVLTIGLSKPDAKNLDRFKTEAEKLSWIKHVGSSDYLPMYSPNYTGFTWESAEPDEFLKMNINYVGPEFTDAYDIELVKGNGFRSELTNQDQIYVLVNEKAIEEMGWRDDPIGKELVWGVDYRGTGQKRAVIAGITEDYHYLSKHQPISPIIMPLLNLDAAGRNLSIKLHPGDISEQLTTIQEIFQVTYPDELFNYRFADELVGRMYESEKNMSQLVLWLTFIAIFIAIMGMIGLVSYTANQKKKEIGIRKVNGASFGNIIHLISSDFLRLLLIGFIMSCPLSLILMENWFSNFAYQTSLSWWVFAVTLAGMLLISFGSIGLQTFGAARKNPVEVLRNE